MQDKPITVLLCGAGSRGRTVFGQFALENPDLVKIVAICEPLQERLEATALEHQVSEAQRFHDWRELPTDKALAQVAIVATDDNEHVEPSCYFLDRGYHLLLEKPMATSLAECERLVTAAESATGLSAVCHILRYTDYFQKLRELVKEGLVGDIVNIRHFEPVNYWHFAHSFVRGNWKNSKTSSPFILAKCCHDMDILLFLMGRTPTAIQSFGNLFHFKADNAPAGAALRCLDCELKESCTYSAPKFYGDMLARKAHWWPLDVVTTDFTKCGLHKALTEGPYGQCVYHSDNDVCDHQVVNLEFDNGSTASLVATAFTEYPARETDIFGSHGMLRGDGSSIHHHDFLTGQKTSIKLESQGHHLGGDHALLQEFFQAVRSAEPQEISTSPTISLLSHKMAFLAEKSRLEKRVIQLDSQT